MRIVEPWERPPVEQLAVLIYGLPATGKTTAAFSAASPVLLDFDHGADRAANVGKSVVINSWQDVSGITADELAGVETVIVDTLGAAQDYLKHQIIADNRKLGRDGELTLQGFGALKTRFTNWLSHIKSMGKDVVLLAHTQEDQRGDAKVVDRITMTGGSKEYVLRSSDAIGRMTMSDGRRTLSFEPTELSIGKNPGRLPALEVPDESSIGSFLADVIRQIKERINENVQASNSALKDRQEKVDLFDQSLDGKTLEQLNAVVDDVRKDSSIDPLTRRQMVDAVRTFAELKGWVFDRDEKRYVEAPTASEPAEVSVTAEAEAGPELVNQLPHMSLTAVNDMLDRVRADGDVDDHTRMDVLRTVQDHAKTRSWMFNTETRKYEEEVAA